MSVLVPWVETHCGLVGKCHHFRGSYCLHLQAPNYTYINDKRFKTQ
jgi:hypothetical protein